ncbi:MAG: aminoacyl-histidine dipeptidase [Bacteroidales bacterium]|nr:aminoacyl-histidine dipeptidase [Bacteroidales bacterium]
MSPERVLDIFKEITRIPRESGHEGPITDWLCKWAADHALQCRRDETGNVLIIREAAPGKESVPTIVLQAHQDMVCEKNAGVKHDFRKDPIPYVIEDGWMIAKDTTLGADDGIGIAACLALLEDSAPTCRIECLFTISEETGMDGAEALQPGFFEGKTLINLDSEDEGQLFIGCAGGLNTNIRFRVRREAADKGCKFVRCTISGGIGGHSGDDINKERANTVQLMARFLYSRLDSGLRLVSIDGGGKPNAIARECEALVAVPDAKAFKAAFGEFAADVKEEFHATDPALQFEACNVAGPELLPVSARVSRRIITALFTCPHGVQAMSQDIPGLVQTSTNLASVKTHKDRGIVEIVTSQRSSARSERRAIAAKVRANFESAGAQVRHMYEYPGWNPDVNSHILARTVEAYRRLFNTEPEVKAIHAGLECGLFLEKFPGLDMISFGPTLRGVHAPGERLELASMDKFVLLLDELVRNFE